MRIDRFTFGSIRIDGVDYGHDVVIVRGRVRKRKKNASNPYRDAFGHTPLSVEVVARLAALVLASRHFYLAPELTLEFVHRPAEELAWEVFRGRLLDPAHTRQTRTFESWNLYLAGEILDLDGPIGGYNFQAAFSTGWLAGESV